MDCDLHVLEIDLVSLGEKDECYDVRLGIHGIESALVVDLMMSLWKKNVFEKVLSWICAGVVLWMMSLMRNDGEKDCLKLLLLKSHVASSHASIMCPVFRTSKNTADTETVVHLYLQTQSTRFFISQTIQRRREWEVRDLSCRCK